MEDMMEIFSKLIMHIMCDIKKPIFALQFSILYTFIIDEIYGSAGIPIAGIKLFET